MLSESLLPAVVELARDRMWRVRLAIIEHMPLLAKQLGPDGFNQGHNENNLAKLSIEWLSDEVNECKPYLAKVSVVSLLSQVNAIREAACTNLKNLAAVFGEDWAKSFLMPEIQTMRKSQNYLQRLTTLRIIKILADTLSTTEVEESLLPVVLQMCDDSVPNVRFNVSKTLGVLVKHCSPDKVATQVKPQLQQMTEDQDPDVKYFSYVAFQSCS